MTLQSTDKLLKLLRSHGVSHFKSPSIEVRIDFAPQPSTLHAVGPSLSETKAPESAAAAPPVEMPIPHHINQVAQMLKMGDEDLVDALFPEPKIEKGE